jgi:uncharacterized protein (TIGR02302 family)
MTEAGPNHLDRKIALAGAAIAFERVWAALLWPAVVACAAAALVLSGLLTRLPDLPRLALLLVAGLVFLASFRDLFRVSWPSRREAMRRIELSSGLLHRPVSGLDDRLATTGDDPVQQAIWDEHRLRQLRALKDVAVGPPQSRWRFRDAAALRVPALLALAAALVLGPGDPARQLVQAVTLTPAEAAPQLVMDAWLKPPAYTTKPPLLLTSPAMVDRLKADPEILVPENSVLTLRMTNAAKPVITFHEIEEDGSVGPQLKSLSAKSKFENGLFTAEAKLTRPAMVVVKDGEGSVAAWPITLIPDTPPTVNVVGTPAGDSSGTLTFDWKAHDDYGVSAITADVSLADEQDDGIGFSGNGIFLFDPPRLQINVRGGAKDEDGTTSADVAEHPWAGFMVELTLTARDAAGHEANSGVVRFRLPERLFTKPLARALIEQRRQLILEPDTAPDVEEMLDLLLAYPPGLIEGSGTHLAIAMVASRLRSAKTQDDIDEAIGQLWQIAVGVEEGTMANARAELDALRKELERALAEGAPPERIAELMDKMRQAMDRYMQSLMEETQKRLDQGELNGNQQMPQQGQMVSPQDLQKMLDMIEKLAESGANDAARDLLAQLDEILRNLQPGTSAQQMPQQGDSQIGQMLDQLSDLLRQQQQLMDDTQRMPQQGEGGEDGQQGDSAQGKGPGDLADRQQGLGQMLEQLMRQFGQNGMDTPETFGQAGKNMDGAQGSLRQGDREGALGEQGQALDNLRRGAQSLAQQMMQQGQGQQGSKGRNGEARGDTDPLGRPMPQHGTDMGPDKDMLPTEQAIRRAREILDMLRSRASEPDLPRLDRDYIDRLLRGLY